MFPDRHMMPFIVELITNSSFVLQTNDGQINRLRRLKNGVPQGSVLAPLLFNIYIHDLPDIISRKYGYANDLAILTGHREWKNDNHGRISTSIRGAYTSSLQPLTLVSSLTGFSPTENILHD